MGDQAFSSLTIRSHMTMLTTLYVALAFVSNHDLANYIPPVHFPDLNTTTRIMAVHQQLYCPLADDPDKA
jgi:hypothetical protein